MITLPQKLILFFVILFVTALNSQTTQTETSILQNTATNGSTILPDFLMFNETQKAEQREAGKQLKEAIKNAIDAKKPLLTVTKRHYRFDNSKETPIQIKSKHDMVIDFSESTFWLEDVKTSGSAVDFLSLNGCKNLTIKNMYVDWDPLPYVQGEIIAVNNDYKITVKLDKSFINLENKTIKTVKAFLNHNNPDKDKRPWIHSFLFDKETKQFKNRQHRNRVEPFFDNPVGTDFGTYELTCKFDPIGKKTKRKTWEEDINMEVGDLIVLQLRGSRPAIETGGSKNVHFENVTLYASGEIGFSEGNGEGPNYYTNCKVTKRPETTRLLSIGADGINSFNQVNGPIITNSLFEYNGDDAIHIHGTLNKVLHKISETEYFIKNTVGKLKTEETIDFYDWQNSSNTYAGQRIIKKIIKHSITLPESTEPVSGYKITLNKGITINTTSINNGEVQYAMDYYSGRNAKIEDCTFKDTYGKGVLVLSPDMTIKNNYFEHVGLYAVQICDEHIQQWNIGVCPYNINISDNTWCNNGFWSKIPDGKNHQIFLFGKQNTNKVNRKPFDIHLSNNTDCSSKNENRIISVTAPDKLVQGQSVTVSVKYEATTNRKIVSVLQLGEDPYTTNWNGKYAVATKNVSAGFDTVKLTFTVPNNVPVGTKYQIQNFITEPDKDWYDGVPHLKKYPVEIASLASSKQTKLNLNESFIYPNPGSGLFNLNYSSAYKGEVSINIFTIDGKQINEFKLQKKQVDFTQDVDLTNQVSGLYIINFKAGNYQNSHQIIKE